ncbi:MAG: EAL domain-containing protein, partial [Microthrixaceae bacterium]|nr:EAL domain-containing protein [Microthrixaceae bacterium]
MGRPHNRQGRAAGEDAAPAGRTGTQRLVSGLLEGTQDLVVLSDPAGNVVLCNRAATEFFGRDLEGEPDRSELGEVASALLESLRQGGPSRWSGDVGLTAPDGELTTVSVEAVVHEDDSGEPDFTSVVARDISERVEQHRRLERQASRDPLTDLPNRATLFERISEASAAIGSDPDQHLALLFIDLDRFKVINDALGHSVGDQLLRAISRRVRTAVRPGDVVSRFGGDEFVVLCEGVESIDAATAVASRVESTLQAPFRVEGHDIHVGVSIGIAVAREPADAEEILRNADTAMYRAKSDGRGQWVLFDEELRRSTAERQETLSALRTTRHGDALELHYQPIVQLDTMAVVGVEALLRWERDGVLVTPDSFMQVAEETGLISSIGAWVIEEAMARLAVLRERPGCGHLRMSVNVSARQVADPGFTATVQSALASSGVSPHSVAMEVTETALLDDAVVAAAVLESLRAIGLAVAIDDFGTGYSSLTYLHTLPVDVVKLDRSFVVGAASDERRRAIVEAVIGLTATLGLATVAEGVETLEELDMLRELGCGFAQGNVIKPACTVAQLESFLDE